jgi:predicted nucleotidyltransferase
MAKTALELSPKEWKAYQPAEAIKLRQMEEAEKIKGRKHEAHQLAQEAADLLKRDFGAERVLLFGSLTGDSNFTLWSDIDLAAWGIPSNQFYEAVATVTGMSSEFKVDLVDPDSCRPSLRDAINKDGIEL